MGPILIFDKSVLEGISKPDALLLQRYFYTNITPVLFLEVLADLKEPPRKETQTPSDRVAILADKLPVSSSIINAHHDGLLKGELFLGCVRGEHVKMESVPIASSIPRIVENNGQQMGLFYEESDEEKALAAWRGKQFSRLDDLLAQQWKDTQKSLDLAALSKDLRIAFSAAPKFSTAAAVKAFVDETLLSLDEKKSYVLLDAMLQYFGAEDRLRREILECWKLINKRAGRIIMPHQFSPYAYYVFSVQLFFNLALSQELVASGKSSKSHIDLQYLYYLPFCMVFASNDKFHKAVVPLFMRKDQKFIDGEALRDDMRKMTAHLASLDPDAKEKRNSSYPPQIENSVICDSYDQFCPHWRREESKPPIKLSKEENDKLMARLRLPKKNLQMSKPFNGEKDMEKFEFVTTVRALTRKQMKDQFGTTDEQFDKMVAAQEHEDNAGID